MKDDVTKDLFNLEVCLHYMGHKGLDYLIQQSLADNEFGNDRIKEIQEYINKHIESEGKEKINKRMSSLISSLYISSLQNIESAMIKEGDKDNEKVDTEKTEE